MILFVNSWVSIRDDFVMGNTDPEAGPLSDNALFFAHAVDASVVGGLYKNEETGGRTWDLWSVYFPDNATMDDAIDDLQSNNPGQTNVLGAWNQDGSQYLPPSGYAQYGNLLRYMPDVPDPEDPEGPFIPATVIVDTNILFGQTPRVFT